MPTSKCILLLDITIIAAANTVVIHKSTIDRAYMEDENSGDITESSIWAARRNSYL
jgi:hypothetical protein